MPNKCIYTLHCLTTFISINTLIDLWIYARNNNTHNKPLFWIVIESDAGCAICSSLLNVLLSSANSDAFSCRLCSHLRRPTVASWSLCSYELTLLPSGYCVFSCSLALLSLRCSLMLAVFSNEHCAHFGSLYIQYCALLFSLCSLPLTFAHCSFLC